MGMENFTILKILGEGAFASVHKVTRLSDNKTYALKKVDVGSLDDKEMISALNEIRLLASFSHPRIVRLYETFLDGNNLCIVMEYCGWGDLAMKIKRYVKRREYIDERVIWVYMIQILEGLKALHERNVLHRDLKPANCFLAEDGSIKIGDMNVSKVAKDGNARTQIGTPYYMSPEIWARKQYNYATDIWSTGCLIYELCALRPPFLGNNMQELKASVMGGHFPPIPSVYSTELSVVVGRMLMANPRDRPTAAQTLNFPEVQARKCLVKNVLRDEDVGPAPSHTEDALIPTINISSLQELASKLPAPSYPFEPISLTSPTAAQVEALSPDGPLAAEARRASVLSSEGSSSPNSRASVIHARRGSVVPVNVERASVSHARRKSVDVPNLPDGALPKLASLAEEGSAPAEAPVASEPALQRRPSVQRRGTSPVASDANKVAASKAASEASNVTPVGEVGRKGSEKGGSIQQLLHAAKQEVFGGEPRASGVRRKSGAGL